MVTLWPEQGQPSVGQGILGPLVLACRPLPAQEQH